MPDMFKSSDTKPKLYKCPSCDNVISERASSCPKCEAVSPEECGVCSQAIPKDSETCPKCGDPEPFDSGVDYNQLYSLLSGYMFLINDVDVGSLEASKIKDMMTRGAINSETLVSKKGGVYKPISSISELIELWPTTKVPSTIICFHCENLISERTKACPKCGNERGMKCGVCNKVIPASSSDCPECGDPNPFDEKLPSTSKIIKKSSVTSEKPVKEVVTNTQNTQSEKVEAEEIHRIHKKQTPKRERKLLAFIVCAVIFFLYHFIVSGPLVG